MDQHTARDLARLQRSAERAQRRLWDAASRLIEAGEATQCDIARTLGVNQSTVSRRLDALARNSSSAPAEHRSSSAA